MRETQEEDTRIICSFLQAHPLISVMALEREVGMPQGAIWKAENGVRLIPVKYIQPLMGLLTNYGLSSPKEKGKKRKRKINDQIFGQIE